MFVSTLSTWKEVRSSRRNVSALNLKRCSFKQADRLCPQSEKRFVQADESHQLNVDVYTHCTIRISTESYTDSVLRCHPSRVSTRVIISMDGVLPSVVPVRVVPVRGAPGREKDSWCWKRRKDACQIGLDGRGH